MNHKHDRPAGVDSLRIFETGVRVALEEMLMGRDYARVEDILRALAHGSSPRHKLPIRGRSKELTKPSGERPATKPMRLLVL